MKKEVKLGALSGRTWSSILIFGVIGQLAWVIENMYFSRFMQNEITPKPYATTLLVACSALFATFATLVGGALCDRTGKRKVFITWGYIVWGFTIMAFSLIPLDLTQDQIMPMVMVVVAMDCIMTLIGSISNDAAYNTWITDITNTANRSKIDTILAILPLVATAIVFVGFDAMASQGNWKTFFFILGVIPIVGGVLGLFIMKDKESVVPNKNNSFWNDFTYSLKPSVIKQNKLLYICLSGNMIAAIASQIFMNYFFNILEKTLKIDNYIIPLAAIGGTAAVISVIVSSVMDKKGKKHFYYPTIVAGIIGGILVWSSKFFIDTNPTLKMIILIIGGIPVFAVTLIMAGLFTASYRDCIPKGKEGLFQGCRMVMYVLVPMVIGPLISNFIIEAYNKGVAEQDYVYPMELFLGAAIVFVFCFIPASVLRKRQDSKHAELMAELEKESK